ncbi:hypothetical protein HDV00_009299 [Rhizophlyctis rosea]|nr:hypothetical protein HDV00_009299 [Rhizophlyctis rosea]
MHRSAFELAFQFPVLRSTLPTGLSRARPVPLPIVQPNTPLTNLQVLYTVRVSSIVNWLRTHAQSPNRLGFDTETRPTFVKGDYNPTALLQLATLSGHVLLVPGFQVGREDWAVVKPELERVLGDPNIWKVGVGVAADVEKLIKDWDLDLSISACKCVDVSLLTKKLVGWEPPLPPQQLKQNATDTQDANGQGSTLTPRLSSSQPIDSPTPASNGGPSLSSTTNLTPTTSQTSSQQPAPTTASPPNASKQKFGLRDLSRIYLGINMSKKEQMQNWERFPLTEAMARYASLDAWAGVAVLDVLEEEFEQPSDMDNVIQAHWEANERRDLKLKWNSRGQGHSAVRHHPYSRPSTPDDFAHNASLIYNYHRMYQSLPSKPVDAIFCLCSLDIRVARHAAQLYLAGHAPLLIFSGNVGALTEGRFTAPEADVFADIAKSMGVPASNILVENKATNTGENVRFTYQLLREKGLQIQHFILVQKPYMEKRTCATFAKQWPDSGTKFTVTSPSLEWEEYPDVENPAELVINIMVGDLVRIRDYPAKGYQIAMEMPEDVWEAGQWLIKAGFDRHLP